MPSDDSHNDSFMTFSVTQKPKVNSYNNKMFSWSFGRRQPAPGAEQQQANKKYSNNSNKQRPQQPITATREQKVWKVGNHRCIQKLKTKNKQWILIFFIRINIYCWRVAFTFLQRYNILHGTRPSIQWFQSDKSVSNLTFGVWHLLHFHVTSYYIITWTGSKCI